MCYVCVVVCEVFMLLLCCLIKVLFFHTYILI
jgi:hypothetical protein